MPRRQITVTAVQPIDLSVGQFVSCYNQPTGGAVVFRDGQPICTCGEPIVCMKSATDPGSAVACLSIKLHEEQSATMPDYQPDCRRPLHSHS